VTRRPERSGDERLRDMFRIWSLIQETGGLMQPELTRRLTHGRFDTTPALRSVQERNAANAKRKRDLDHLIDSELIREAFDNDGRRWLLPGYQPIGHWISLTQEAQRSERPVFPDIGGRPGSREEREFSFALADLSKACAEDGPGSRLMARLIELYRRRYNDLPPTGSLAYRHLVPSFSTSLEKIAPEFWRDIFHALLERRQLRLWYRKKRVANVVNPLRIVQYNGRPRLECTVGLGTRRLAYFALYRITRLELLDSRIHPGDILSTEESGLLEQVWGLDGHQDEQSTPARVAERLEDVWLVFRGQAISAIEEDPGCRQARCERFRDGGAKALSYRVRTIPGPDFVRWLRSWGADVQVVAPDWLREAHLREAKMILSHARTSHEYSDGNRA